MRRRIFNLLAVVSLVLCAGTGVLWVGSHFRCYAARWQSSTTSSINVDCPRGELVISRSTGLFAAKASGFSVDGRMHDLALSNVMSIEHPIIRLAGLIIWSDVDSRESCRGVAVPFWMVTFSSAGLLLFLLRYGQFTPGLCPTCGYDLRASPERCPECGAGQG